MGKRKNTNTMKTLITLLMFLPLFVLGQRVSIGDLLLEEPIPSIHYDKKDEIDLSKIGFSSSSIDCSKLERCIDEIIIVNDNKEILYRKVGVEGKVDFSRLSSGSYYMYLVRGNHVTSIRLHRS